MEKRSIVVFVAGVVLAAACGFAAATTAPLAFDWMKLFLLASLAAVGGATPVRIPAFKGAVSASDPFVFTTLAALGPAPACLVSAAGVLGGLARHRPSPVKRVFNLANCVLATAVASFVFDALGGVPGAPLPTQLWPLMAATAAYFVCNTGLVSTAIVLDTGGRWLRTWYETGLWAAVGTFAGVTLAAGLLLLLNTIGAAGLALGVPPCWLIFNFYQTHTLRAERQLFKIEQIETLNSELEDKVAERTAELQQALAHIEKANERLRTANERLTEANRAKDEFLANVSHELRTPLNAIIGFSDLLRDGSFGALDDQQREFVRDIHESGEHLLDLINGILDLSKIEAGRLEAHPEELELERAIEEALAMVRPQAAKKRLSLAVGCASDVEVCRVDPGMFRQVLINLLSNAVKFTPDGGRVAVHARREAADDLVVSVEDSGVGIAEEHLARVFDEFYQVDGSYTRNYEGTGLGLALVKRLVALHGGTVEVRSKANEGSCFTCRFPDCVGRPRADALPAEEALLAPTSGRTIVVVEDNTVQRKLVCNVLRSRGHRVREAGSGEEAMGLLAGARTDLVLLDLDMPDADSREVVRLVLDAADPAPPIVGLVDAEHGDGALRARALGCVGSIATPVSLAGLAGSIEGYLALN